MKVIEKIFSDGSDVKNLELSPRSKIPSGLYQDITFRGVNFNAPMVGGSFGRTEFRNCSFVQCNLGGLNGRKIHFTKCSIVNSQLDSEFSLFRKGEWKDSTFENVKFGAVELQSVSILSCVFIDCCFRKVNLKGCLIEGGDFQGIFNSVNWINCQTRNVNLKKVRMTDVSLVDSDDHGISFPDSETNFFVPPCAFSAAKTYLKDKLSAEVYSSFCDEADFFSDSRYGEMVDPSMFSFAADHEIDLILTTLRTFR